MLLALAQWARAQPEAASKARMHVGPLALKPRVALTNIGIDDNVFNQADVDHPQGDFTIILTPSADWWLRLGRSWLKGTIREDLVYFKQFSSERSANNFYSAELVMPLNRLTLIAATSYLNTRERPGFEIDARSRRGETEVRGKVEVRVLGQTFLGVTARRRGVAFDKDAIFLGNSLHFELNRTETSGGLFVRRQLTPLTGLTLNVEREQDRFEFSPLRNADSTRLGLGLKFDPFALIGGSVTLGYCDFHLLVPGQPNYKGVTAQVDVTYTMLESTKFTIQGLRDVQFSYDITLPFYLQTGINASIAQHVYGPAAVVGRFGVQRLDYHDRGGAELLDAGRTDYLHTYGFGIEYRLNRELKLGFNLDQYHRTSAVERRRYDAPRYGASVMYGF